MKEYIINIKPSTELHEEYCAHLKKEGYEQEQFVTIDGIKGVATLHSRDIPTEGEEPEDKTPYTERLGAAVLSACLAFSAIAAFTHPSTIIKLGGIALIPIIALCIYGFLKK